jgi:DNA-binding PucR family transcriptional regulator
MSSGAATRERERRNVASAIVSLAEDLATERADLGRRMAEYLHGSIPAFAEADGELLAETQASCEANIAQILQMLERSDSAEKLILPPAAAAYVDGMVRRGVPLPILLRAYRLGHQWLWSRWSEALRERVADADALGVAMEQSSAFMFSYIDLIADALVEEYGSERDRLVRSAAAQRAEVVRSILAREPIDEEVASKRLGYELARHHVALRVSGDPAGAAELRGLERAAEEAARALGPGNPLTVPAGVATLDVWWGSHKEPGDAKLAALGEYEPPEGIRIAAGRPGRGLDGFRRSREEAAEAARVQSLAHEALPGGVTRYADVELLSLLTADERRARRFVANQLGDLAAPDASVGRLRETLLVFLQGNCSNVKAARALHVHQNTVVYRVNRAEALIGRTAADNGANLMCALIVAELLGDEALATLTGPPA